MSAERGYDRIIDLPHHQSAVRPHMPRASRAAQFAPFAALTGYDGVIREAGRRTEARIELGEDEKVLLDRQLRELRDRLRERLRARITWFRPDSRKEGGAYVTAEGAVVRADPAEGVLVLEDRTVIPIGDIAAVELAFPPPAP